MFCHRVPLTAKRQPTMNTGDISCKLVGVPAPFRPLRRMVHGVGDSSYLLPFLIGECCRMEATMSLLFVLHRSSIIVRSVGRIKFIAEYSGDGITGKQSFTKALAASAVACCIHPVCNFISRIPLQA